jgi:hypothetical protein
MPTVASTEALARAAIARMDDNERCDALLTLLPRLIRDEDRRRAQSGSGDVADTAAAWTAATEYRVRVDGDDMFLSDASADDVDQLAETRLRAATNILGSVQRFETVADAMRQADVQTVAALDPEVGLAALRQELRAARRRVANRDALQRLSAFVDGLDISPQLASARAALQSAEAAIGDAERARTELDEFADSFRTGTPAGFAPFLDQYEGRTA